MTGPTIKPTGLESISGRQKEVLALVAQGHPNKEIAARLFISLETVRTHVSALLEKTNTSNRTLLAIFAHQNNLLAVENGPEQGGKEANQNV